MLPAGQAAAHFLLKGPFDWLPGGWKARSIGAPPDDPANQETAVYALLA